MVDILMITYNRSEYTMRALSRLLETCDDQMRVTVWHNGSDTATLEVVRSFSSHPRFHKLHVSEENKKLREPTNWFWENSTGAYVSKVDDDCLLPDGWAQTLRDTHRENPEIGVIGCWRFYDQDLLPNLVERKLRRLAGGHRIMLSCWVQGSGYLMKRKCVETLGPILPTESFTDYCIRVALKGWLNGWYYPFIHEEHMDDPRSPYCLIRTDEEFMAKRPLSAVLDNVTSLSHWAKRVQAMALSVQMASADPREYAGWRRFRNRAKRKLERLLGIKESWRRGV